MNIFISRERKRVGCATLVLQYIRDEYLGQTNGTYIIKTYDKDKFEKRVGVCNTRTFETNIWGEQMVCILILW